MWNLLFIGWLWIVSSILVSSVSENSDAIPYYNQAVHTQTTNVHQALELYKQALLIDFVFPEAHQNIALLYDRIGEYDKAHEHNMHSLETSDSNIFMSYAILNTLLLEMKMVERFPHTFDQFVRWIQYCDRAILLSNSTNAEAFFNKALLQRQIGNFDEALQSFQFILTNIDNGHIRSYLNIGNHYFFHDEFKNASDYYLLALGKALEQLDKANYAILSRKWDKLDLVVSILNNVAQSFREQGLYYQSLYYFQFGYNLLNKVMDSDYHMTLGNDEPQVTVDVPTLSVFKQPVRMVLAESKAWMVQNIYTIKGMLNHWKEYEELESLFNKHLDYFRRIYEDSFVNSDKLINDVSKLKQKEALQYYRYIHRKSEDEAALDPYTASLIGFSTWEQDLWICNKVCDLKVLKSSAREVMFHPAHVLIQLSRSGSDENGVISSINYPTKTGEKYEIKMLRIGYLSYDWRDHPMGRLTAAIVTTPPKELSRTRKPDGTIVIVKREVHCFSYGKNDGSTIRRFISKYCSVFHDAFGARNDHSVAEYINQQKIHVLVDITGHTYNGRLGITALQPSLVTINYLGYPGVASCQNSIDFTMVDNQVMPPEYVTHYQHELQQERFIYLPFSYQANNMPVTIPYQEEKDNGDILSSPPSAGRKINICVFNANKKFEPFSFHSFMNIMNEVPQSNLILLDFYNVSQQELLYQFAFYGIPSSRVIFLTRVSWEQHLGRAQKLCDIAIDTFVYGAHTTATDLLFSGIPIFTLRGYGLSFGKMPSRVASSIVDNLDSFLKVQENTNFFRLKDILVHDTVSSYEQTIIDIVKDHLINQKNSRLTKLKQRLMSVSCYSPSFDKYLLTKHLDLAYSASVDVKSWMMLESRLFPMNTQFHIVLEKSGLEHLKFNSYCEIDGHIVREDVITSRLDSEVIISSNSLSILATIDEIDREKFLGSILSWNYMNSPTFQRPTKVQMKGEIIFTKDLVNQNKILEAIESRLSRKTSWNIHNKQSPVFFSSNVIKEVKDPPLPVWFQGLKDLSLIPLTIKLRSLHDQITEESVLNKKLIFTHLFFQLLFEYQFDSVYNDTVNSSSESELWELCLSDSKMWLNRIFEVYARVATNDHVNSNELFEFVRNNVISCSTFHLLSESTLDTVPWIHEGIRKSDKYRRSSMGFPYRLKAVYQHQLKAIVDPEIRSLVLKEIAFMVNNHALFHHQLMSEMFQHEIADLSLDQQYLKLQDLCHLQRSCSNAWEGFIRVALSFLLEPQQPRLMDLGLYATKLRQNNPFAFVLTEFAVLIAHYTDAQRDSSKPFSSPVNNQQHEQQVTVNTKKIAIYCNEYGQSWWPGWGPRSFDKNKTNANRGGVGGSEEAVYFISIDLAKLGYQVDVYGDVDKDQDGLMVYSSTVQENSFVRRRGFVCWKQMSTFDPFSCLSDVNINNCYDAFIAWRYSISLVLGIHSAKTRFLWLHDLLTSESLPPLDLIFSDVPESSSSQDNRNLLHLWCHGIWVQSKFHQDFIRNEYSKLSQSRNSRVLIVPNGIPDEEIAMLQKNPKHHDVNRNDIFIYGSAPNRGLQEVLELWHNIRNYRPSATLHIFYGFTPKATEAIRKQFGESSEDQKRFEVWMQYMQKLLQKDGVVYHGHVDHATLMNAYAHAGFLLYPTSFPETGCITMIRAMIAGAIPISSKFTNSVLATLGGEFDLGPSGEDALNLTIATNYQSKLDWLVKKYVPRVFDVLDLPIDMLNDLRNRMTLRMREKYSWGESAKVADNIFDTTHRYFLD